MMKRSLLMLGATASLAACSFEPHYVRPATPVPPSWPQGDAYLTQSEAALPSVDYRQVLSDPRLQQLITTALENNRTALRADGLVFGRCRSAIGPTHSIDGTGCTHCGLCMYGCPYKAIFSAEYVVQQLVRNPDFTALARAYGAWAEAVETTGQFGPALNGALAEHGVRVLHLRTDVEYIAHATTLSKLRS